MFRTYDPFRDPFFSGTGLDYDVLRSEDGVMLRVDLPGVDPESIDLTVDGRSLTIAAERSVEVPDGATVVRRGRNARSVNHRFQLSEQLDADGLSADFEHGVLTVTIPVAESAKPRKVLIGSGAPALDA